VGTMYRKPAPDVHPGLRRFAFPVGQGDARHSGERAEESDSAGDDVKLVAARISCLGVERDVFGMLDQHSVAAFQRKKEFLERDSPDKTVNLCSNGIIARHAASGERLHEL